MSEKMTEKEVEEIIMDEIIYSEEEMTNIEISNTLSKKHNIGDALYFMKKIQNLVDREELKQGRSPGIGEFYVSK